jgi:hypothetical protein
MYKLQPIFINPITNISYKGNCVLRLSDNASIPIAPDNTDFAQFKKDLIEGAELQNAEGEVMTKADITEFMRSLP